MATIKLVEDWNKVFNFKISASDLQKPTQSFLYEALQCFLRNIHIDVDKVKVKIAGETVNNNEHKFRIYLVKYINHFFQVTGNNSINFLYWDLIQPQSKKTIGILKFLLNYYLYFTMVKEEVVGTANAKIEKYEKLLSLKNQLQVQHEECKIESMNKERELEEYKKSIVENKKQLVDLKAKKDSLNEKKENVSEQLQSIKRENVKLDYEIQQAKLLIVPAEKVDYVTKDIKAFEAEICNLNATEQEIANRNKEYVDEITRMNAEIEKLDKAVLISNTDGNEKYRENVKKLKETNFKIEEIKGRIEHATLKQKECMDNIQSLQDQLSNKKHNINTLQVDRRTKKMSMESELKLLVLKANDLEQSITLAEHILQELQSSQEFILAKGNEVIQQIAKSPYTSWEAN